MAALTKAVDDRLAALLFAGAGDTRTIPQGRFRRSADRMALTDPNHPGNPFDRTVEFQYLALGDHEPDRPQNPYAPAWLVDLTVNVRVGYAVGSGSNAAVALAAGTLETASAAALNARARALNDAQRIWRCLNANFRFTSADPQLVDCVRVGDVVIDDLGSGRLVCTSTFRVELQLDPANDYEFDE